MASIDLSEAGGMVRLFPLPGVVLFPCGHLPLRIFEPRYLEMTEDALAGDKLITMVLPAGAVKEDRVPLNDVGCVGKIRQERRLPNGWYHFVLRGLARVRILEERETDRPYRLAQAEVLHDAQTPGLRTRRLMLRSEIMARLRSGPEESATIKRFLADLSTEKSSGAFADLVAFAAPLTIELKQRLLATTDVDRRLEVLAEALRNTGNPLEADDLSSAFGPN